MCLLSVFHQMSGPMDLARWTAEAAMHIAKVPVMRQRSVTSPANANGGMYESEL